MKKIIITVLILLSLCSIATAENVKFIHDGSKIAYYQFYQHNLFTLEFPYYGSGNYIPFVENIFGLSEVIFEDTIFEKIWGYICAASGTCSYDISSNNNNFWGQSPKYVSSNPSNHSEDANGNYFSKFEAYEKGIWNRGNPSIVRMFAWCDDLSIATGTFGFTKAPLEVIFPGIDSTHPDYEGYLQEYGYRYVSNPNDVYILYALESMREAIDAYNQKHESGEEYHKIYVWKYVTSRPVFQIAGE